MSQADSPVHPALVYIEVQTSLKSIRKKGWSFPIEDHPLASELSALRCEEATCEDSSSLSKIQLLSAEDSKDLGTIGSVDVSAVRTLATPSSFGKGTETVYDESVRKGTEIPASKLRFEHGVATKRFEFIARSVGKRLFPRQPVKLIFYKLAIYEAGGHFSKHRDTTHADSHQGTLLVSCTARDVPAYEGGDFFIHHGDGNSLDWPLRDHWVAFFTDLEHSVEPVTSGIRLTLQFDIYIESADIERAHTVACVPPQEPLPDDNSWNEDDKFLISFDQPDPDPLPTRSSSIMPSRFVPDVLDIIRVVAAETESTGEPKAKRVKKDAKPRTVAFLLQHLYRQQSLLPTYLKGVDRALFDALLKAEPNLVIAIYPVFIELYQYGDDPWEQRVMLACPDAEAVMAKIRQPVTFIRRTGIETGALGAQQGAEHTGNEALPAEYSYFAGAMFLSFP